MDELLARIVAWAEAQPDVRGAILVGSYARSERPADESSDLDLVVVANGVILMPGNGDGTFQAPTSTAVGSALFNYAPLEVLTADFNQDSKPDYALLNSTTRQTAIWYLNNNAFVSGAFGPTLPAGWSLVKP